jgi:hypothetical protein
MMASESSPREDLILEVLRAASERISIQDFDVQCQLAPVSLGKSYHDRMRTAESLIEEGLIEKIDDRLRVVGKEVPEWLRLGMLNGSNVAWNIFETIDTKGKIKGKVNQELLLEIGIEGENAVIFELKRFLPTSLATRIKHISLTDDSAGFDISSPSVCLQENYLLLEVKTSSRPGNEFRFFISRNEARVASQNENWRLVAVRRAPDGYKVLGHLRYTHFSDILPIDSSAFSKWESASINIPTDLIVPGLP